jgi:alkaline phosphatase
VDDALVSQAAVLNEGENLLRETLELDRALQTAVKFAGEKVLIIAVGKHSTGGFALSGYPLREDKGISLLGSTPEGYPQITWATGPNGAQSQQPSAFQLPGALNNAEDVIAIGRGPGSEKLRGFLHHTDIFKLLKSAL